MSDRWSTRVCIIACAAAIAAPCDRSIGAEFFRGPFVLEGAAVHGDKIAFACGGRLWVVGHEGGTAQPITSGAAHDAMPCFSPNGETLAFLRRSERYSELPPAAPDDPPPTVAVYDVYLRTLVDGAEQRLTYHPGRDFPVGWTPDSQRVLLNSARDGRSKLYSMASGEQLPTPFPLPEAYTGSLSPDGRRLAYLPRSFDYHFAEFRYYRGGLCSPLWVVELESGAVERVTDNFSNARDPMWVEERIYFLSDRDGRFDLYVHEISSKETRKLTNFGTFGARGAATDGNSIVLTGDGGMQVFDLASQTARAIAIAVERNESALRPRIVNAAGLVQSYSLNRDGKQAAVAARGDVFLVDTVSGRAANLTKSSGVAEREPCFSPDARRIAYFSDESGEYALAVRPVESAAESVISIESKPSYYDELTWSPDGKRLAFSDKRLAVWMADLSAGAVKRIDRSTSSGQTQFGLNWSPDGRYLAYAKYGENRLPRIYVHDVATGDNHAATPEECHATQPAFDKSGRYLYFLSSPNAASADFGWGVLAGMLSRPLVIRQLSAIVLHRGDPAPVLAGSPNLNVDWKPGPGASIDFDGIESRIVPIDVAPHSPTRLATGEPGVLFLFVEEWPPTPGLAIEPAHALYRLDLRSPSEVKKAIPFVDRYAVSRDGKGILCDSSGAWRLAVFQRAKPTLRPAPISTLPTPVDPAREWRQILHETWRLLRDVLYDPNIHGLDWAAVERRYLEFVPGVTSREELNVLIRRMLGEVSVSHLGVGDGDVLSNLDEPEPVGLLGADLEISNGLYRVKRVLRAGFDAQAAVHAPLAQLGGEVGDGEYLLAIDDVPLDAKQNIYVALRGKASRPVRLLVGKSRDAAKARTVRVTPIANEIMLRAADWAATNRQMVHELSKGQLGYFHVSAYSGQGIQTFFRGYFGSRSKPGIVIDQRGNGGGITPDFFIEMLARRPLYYYLFREGDDLAVPVNGRAAGVMVLMIDERNASAAETFAFMFQLGRIGPLVGLRTSGAGIGPYGSIPMPHLVDGGRMRIPSRGAYNPTGTWGIENDGVHPDVSVEIMPTDWRAGRDPQLEAAVKQGLNAIANTPAPARQRPAFPVHPR